MLPIAALSLLAACCQKQFFGYTMRLGHFMNPNTQKKVGAWGLFLLFFLFLQLADTSYWKIADLSYMSLGFAFITVISILVVRARWRKAQNPRFAYTSPDAGDRLLRAVVRWCGGG